MQSAEDTPAATRNHALFACQAASAAGLRGEPELRVVFDKIPDGPAERGGKQLAEYANVN